MPSDNHTDNPADIKLSQTQVEILDDGGVLMLQHQRCGEALRLFKEPEEDNAQ